MAAITLTVGDRQRSLRVTLEEADGSVPTLTAVVFRIVKADTGVVKINDAAMTIVSPGVVRYDWQAVDVDTAGLFYWWVIDTDAGTRKQTWPDDGRTWSIEWVAAA